MRYSNLELGSYFKLDAFPDDVFQKIKPNELLHLYSTGEKFYEYVPDDYEAEVTICDSNGNAIEDLIDARYKEAVNHPSHYGGADNPYEAIKIIKDLGLLKGFCLGNTIKYIVREGSKEDNPAVQDLKKAAWYLDYYINDLKKQKEV